MKQGNDIYKKIKAELDRLENFQPQDSELKIPNTDEVIRQIKRTEKRVKQILAGLPKR